MIDVLFVILPETLLLDLAGPAEAFRMANQRLRQPAFALRFVGPELQCSTSVGISLHAMEPLPPKLGAASWVVLLGQPSGAESVLRLPLPRAWVQTRRWLTQVVQPRLHEDVRLLTVCAAAVTMRSSRRCWPGATTCALPCTGCRTRSAISRRRPGRSNRWPPWRM